MASRSDSRNYKNVSSLEHLHCAEQRGASAGPPSETMSTNRVEIRNKESGDDFFGFDRSTQIDRNNTRVFGGLAQGKSPKEIIIEKTGKEFNGHNRINSCFYVNEQSKITANKNSSIQMMSGIRGDRSRGNPADNLWNRDGIRNDNRELVNVGNEFSGEIGNDRPGSQTDTTVTLPPEQGNGLTGPFRPSHGSPLILEPEEIQNQWRPTIDIDKVSAPERRVTFSENVGSGRHGFVRNGPPQETLEVRDPIEKLAGILLRSLGNNKKAKIDRQRLPIFSGLDTGNPRVFVTKMIVELQKREIPVEEWVSFVKYQLKGDALTWANHFAAIKLQWTIR
ncbi:hypothetical protein JTB14_016489 [Gonioctena quinquepunctata]|nr:hypothetical protein JTB14_016489 [Gonioctena quinquepunctata]